MNKNFENILRTVVTNIIEFLVIAFAFLAVWMLIGVTENILFIIPCIAFSALAAFFLWFIV